MTISIYRSSAGSGKTYTLAKEYLKLLLKNPKGHAEILGVTFTNKATREMKDRIIDFLIQLSKGENPYLAMALRAETGLELPFVRTHSRIALREILHRYSDFTILTIDSFFHRIIRSFAHELRLPLRMELQLDTESALNDAYEYLLKDLKRSESSQVRKWLNSFMFSQLDNDQGWKIEHKIKSLGKEIFSERFQQVEESVAKLHMDDILRLSEQLTAIILQFEETLRQLAQQAVDVMQDNGLAAGDFSQSSRGVGAYFHRVLQTNNEITKPNSYVQKAVDSVENWFSKSDKLRNQKIPIVVQHLYPLLCQMVEFIEKDKSLYLSALLLKKNIYALGLINTIRERIKQYRDENDSILISDQNRFINQVIYNSEIAFLYEKTGSRFSHFLIDEFQDTSAMQWENFRPLLENSLAQGNNVLLVGDGKQSIYRWRGGDMQLLLNKVQGDMALFADFDSFKNLQYNYRSHQKIIEFNNLFFSNVQQFQDTENTLLQQSFEDVAQLAPDNCPEGGYVEMQLFPADEDEELTVLDIIDIAILNRINSLCEAGYSYGQIAVLVFNNHEGTRVAEWLNQHQIPVQSSESLLLKNAGSIQFIEHLLLLITQPENEIYKAQFVLDLLLREELTGDPHQLLKKCKTTDRKAFIALLPECWQLFLDKNTDFSLLKMVHGIIKTGKLENKDTAFVQRFCELIYEYQNTRNNNLTDFLDWWETKKVNAAIQISENMDAVIISTIHKSKGLQYPVVIHPYAGRAYQPKTGQILWLDTDQSPISDYGFLPIPYETGTDTFYEKALADEKNLTMCDAVNMLYVAFTRAEEQLYLLLPEPKSRSGNQKKISDLIINKIKQTAEFNFDGHLMKWGNKEIIKPKKTNNDSGLLLNSYKTASSTSGILLRNNPLQLSDLAEHPQTAKHKGIKVHGLLAQIQHVNEIEPVLQSALMQGLFSSAEFHYWTQYLQSVLQMDAYRELVDRADIRLAEREIVHHGIVLRPDLLLLKGQNAVVIDYKTGNPHPSHVQQINIYKEALALQFAEVKGYLYYLSNLHLQQI